MSDSDELDQSISYDEQNFDFDINSIYQDFIKEVDSIRSSTTFNDDSAKIFLKNLDPKNKSVNENNLNIENNYQESRIHAFLRLVGLPVLSKNNKFYSPGHDNISGEKVIDKSSKINIALNPIENFDKFTTARESYIQSILKIFSKPSSIDASCLALSSGVSGSQGAPNLRKFVAPFDKSEEALDVNNDNQSYQLKLDLLNGSSLLQFQDENGNTPNISSKKSHYIKPLIVNGKIDFTVSPSTRRVCVPFVYEKNNTLISNNVYGKRPLLEKLIRDRFLNSTDNSSYEETVKNYIKNFSTIKDISIVGKINSSDFDYTDRQKFLNSLKMIQEMIKKLVEATDIIKKTQGKYYWLPIPGIFGPEQGSQVKPVFFPKTADAVDLFSKADISILQKSAQSLFSKFSSEKEKESDENDFALNNFSSTFNKDTTNSLGDSASATLEDLIQTRAGVLSQANQALSTIEIIMGEFSGLGLCDVFAINGALNILPLEDLLGLIDDDAFNRMTKILQIDSAGLTRSPVLTAIKNLSSIVKDFYNIMDQIYIDQINNNIIKAD